VQALHGTNDDLTQTIHTGRTSPEFYKTIAEDKIGGRTVEGCTGTIGEGGVDALPVGLRQSPAGLTRIPGAVFSGQQHCKLMITLNINP